MKISSKKFAFKSFFFLFAKSKSSHLWLISLLFCLKLSAYEYNSYSFNELYNFEHNTIYDIAEDSSRNMWFGSSRGLIKFDGKNFQRYTASGADNGLTLIHFDELQRPYCVNFGGQIFRLNGDSLQLIMEQTYDGNFVVHFKVLTKHKLLYNTWYGTKIMALNTATGKQETFYKTVYDDIIYDIVFTDDFIWIVEGEKDGTSNTFHVRQLSYDGKVIAEFEPIRNIKKIGRIACEKGKDNTLYLLNLKNNLRIWKIGKNENKEVFNDSTYKPIECNAFQFFNQELYALTKKGMARANFTTMNYEAGIFEKWSISKIFRDSEGNIWLSTLNKGLQIIPSLAFEKMKIKREDLLHATHDESNAIYFQDTEAHFYQSAFPYHNSRLISRDIEKVLKFAYNEYHRQLYLGRLLNYYDIEQKQLLRFGNQSHYFKNAIALDSNMMLFSFPDKVLLKYFDSQSKSKINWGSEQVSTAIPQAIRIRNKRALNLACEANKEHVYIDYVDGLMHYKPEQEPEKIYFNNEVLNVNSICAAKTKGVWALTFNNELLKIDAGEIVFEKKLPSEIDRIFQIDTLLFLSTGQHLLRYNVKNDRLSTIDHTDGFYEEQILDLFQKGDSIYVVGENHIQRFPLAYQRVNEMAPQVEIEKLSLFGEKQPFFKNYHFGPDENDLRIDFNAISTRSKGNFQYHYKLGPHSKNWTKTNSRTPYVRFAQLAPGQYTFQLKACNEDHICSEVKTLSIAIDLPFYQKWWFYLLLIGGASLIISVIANYRLRQKKRQAELIKDREKLTKDLYKSQISALQSQMNPHFLFNALNSVQDLVLMKDIRGSNKYLGKFSDLLRKILLSSKDNFITLKEEIDIIQLYLELEKLRFGDDFEYRIETDISLNKQDEIKLPAMIIQPFIENAIKHGLFHKKGSKVLSIKFELHEEYLSCWIEDNGIGYERAKALKERKNNLHTGFSTNSIKNRIELLNEVNDRKIKLSIKDLFPQKEDKGTQVRLDFPL